MVLAKDQIFSQIMQFIKACTRTKLNIYNTSFLVRPPQTTNRIEFKLDSFRSAGHNYKNNDKSGSKYTLGANSMYYATLEIRIIDTPQSAQEAATMVVSGLNHSDMRENYIPFLSVHAHRLRQQSYPVNQDGTIYNIERILCEVSFMNDFEFDIDWFNRVEHNSRFN